MSIEILDDTRSELGEGPTYDPAQDKAWWFDIRGKKLFEHDFAGQTTTIHELPMMASALGVVDETRQLLATESGLYLRDTASGELTLHHPLETDNPATRSNDGRVHQSGALWIGTMGKKMEQGAGAIYWFSRGELRKLYPDISIPNSICFSPDGATAYFADSRKGKLMAVAVDPVDGLPLGEPRVHYDYGVKKSVLDGSVVDADGTIWNACWGGSCLNVISPRGELLRTVPMPARQVSCPAFVGPKLDRLLVTSAWQGMDDAARAQDEHAGKTFILDEPVRGRAEPRIVL
jgi:sugar lactone lactonase YvrE